MKKYEHGENNVELGGGGAHTSHIVTLGIMSTIIQKQQHGLLKVSLQCKTAMYWRVESYL